MICENKEIIGPDIIHPMISFISHFSFFNDYAHLLFRNCLDFVGDI